MHCTLVLLESSHRIERLLEQLALVFPQNRVVIAKELSKLHERVMRGFATELSERLQQDPGLSKGEFVVLIDNPADPDQQHLQNADVETLKLLLGELPLKAAVKVACALTGKKKNDLYQLALELQQAAV